MALQAEQAVDQRIVALFFQKRYRQEFTLGFGHLAVRGVQMMDMEPVIAPFVTEIGLRLGNFIGMVRKRIVDAAAMDIHILAQMLDADAGALNMPPRIADAPWRIPFERLIFKLGLGKPEDKIVLVALVFVLLDAFTNADLQILLIMIVEYIVFFQFGGVKVDIAARKIRISLIQQGFYHMDKFRNAVRGRFDNLRYFDVQFFAVGKERYARR